MFFTFLWKSIFISLIGGTIFSVLLIGIVAIPALLLTKTKNSTVKKIIGGLIVSISFYAVFMISAFFSVRALWYTSLEGAEYQLLYYIISGILSFFIVQGAGSGARNTEERRDVNRLSFATLIASATFMKFPSLIEYFYPFLTHLYG